MNQRGFTLIEVLGVIIIIGIITIISIRYTSKTYATEEDMAYKIVQNSIINATDSYIMECEGKILECSYSWKNNKTIINGQTLIENGYFDKIINPSNNTDISKCIKVEVKKDKEQYKYKIDDEDCK